MKDYGAQREVGFLTRVASYAALLVFLAVLGGITFNLRQCRGDVLRDLVSGESHPELSEREKYDLAKRKSRERFWFGAAFGCGIGVLFLVGYHVTHGSDHLKTKD